MWTPSHIHDFFFRRNVESICYHFIIILLIIKFQEFPDAIAASSLMWLSIVTAVAQVQSLAQELPYVTGAARKKNKKKQNKKKNKAEF